MNKHFSKKPSFKNVPYESPIEHVAGRLVVFPTDNHAYVSGSCVRIAKNLYVTAGHVINDFLDKFRCLDDTIDAECWVVHILSASSPLYAIWQLDCAWVSVHSDLAVFHTRPYNDVAAAVRVSPCLALELSPPQLGERVVGFGYHSSSGKVLCGTDGTRHIQINTFGAASVGEVKDVHLLKRDSCRLPFPCYQVNARFDGGMSGGPITNDRGKLCGIICSNLPPSEPSTEHVSYAATLWPLMAIPITIDGKGNPCDAYPILDLARKGIIRATDWEKVEIVTDKGHQTTVRFLCQM